jgi:hypothetical protein
MTTLSDIANEVFDAVSAELDGVVKSVTLTREGPTGDYDPETGEYPTAPQVTSARAVLETEKIFESNPVSLPFYVPTGEEALWFACGFGFAPKPDDVMTVEGKDFVVKYVRDVMNNGELFRLLVQ